jgi:hypothetical protein
MEERNERQRHGFIYETTILKKFGIENFKNYTDEYDGFCGEHKIQVKCIKHGCAIELGDYMRNKNKKHDFILIIGFWKDSKDNMVEEHIYLIDHIEFTSNLLYDMDSEMFAELKLITNNKDNDNIWKAFCKHHKNAWKLLENKIDIRLKRDHKTQKRIQCAISKYNYNNWFKNTFKELTVDEFKNIIFDINNKQDNINNIVGDMSDKELSVEVFEELNNDVNNYNDTSSDTKQKLGLLRNTVDQYYTKPELAQYYVDLFLSIVKPNDDDLIIEPSAGNGSFSDLLKERKNFLCYDIEPKQSYITQIDFLELDCSIFKDINVHCIGNPPFGRQSSLAKKFIKKCCLFSNSIGFILPKSFKKPSFYKVFSLEFHKVFEEDCPDNAFVVNDKEHNVPCVFQIWVKKDNNRIEEAQQDPDGYQFVKKDNNPDFALRRVGFYAGKAHKDYDDKNIQSHYFIKFNLDDKHDIDIFIEQFNKIEFSFNNTVGAKSVSKSEFIKLLNQEIKKIRTSLQSNIS